MSYWSVAVFDLGLTDKQFWKLTPAQFYALWERCLQSKQEADYRAGVVASMLYNIHRGKHPALDPEDFFASLKQNKKKRAVRKREMSPEQMRQYMAAAFPLANRKKNNGQ